MLRRSSRSTPSFVIAAVASVAAVAALALGAPATASAAEGNEGATPPAPRDDTGRVQLAVASGLAGVPAGSGWIVFTPMNVELGFFPERRVELGFGFEYGESNGLACADCGGWRARGTARARLHLVPGGVVDPWIGGGFGYERLHAPGQAVNPTTFGGVELPTVAFGADVRLVAGLRLGVAVEGDLVWRGPEAPAWSVGESQWPVQVSAVARVAYAF